MEHQYIISGIKGEQDRSAVEKALNSIKGIEAKVTSDPPGARLRMMEHVPMEVLQETLSGVGDFIIKMDQVTMEKQMHDAHQSHDAHGRNHSGDEYGDAGHEEPDEHEHHMDVHTHASGHAHTHGADGHMMHMGNLRQKFWVSLIIAVPIILMSSMMGVRLPFQFSFPGSDWVVLILATILFFYGGMPFLQGAKMELRDKKPAMMTLISMGITVAYIYSLYAFVSNHIFHGEGHRMDFFWELATLVVIMLLGHWIEMRAVGDAGNALQKMAELLPGSAHLIDHEGNMTDVPLQQIQPGNRVFVKAGEKIPADGRVITGDTSVNEAMVTGEARSIRKGEGDKVIGGSVNGNGTVTIEVTGTGESGFLAQVMKLVGEAQQEKSHSEAISDKVARALFYVAVFAGVIAFIVWYVLAKDLNVALERLVTVLIIACPHALGLAIPLVVARSTSLGARNGLLIRNRSALEKSKKIAIVAMDKTGTLTEGKFRVSVIESLSPKWSNEQLLAIMAAIESHSNHPLAAGILVEAKRQQVDFPEAEHVKVIDGAGLSGNVGGRSVKIVKAAYLDSTGLFYDKEQFESLSKKGNSVSYLIVDGEVVGLVAQGDAIKPEAGNTIAGMKKMHLVPVMLTGDNEGYALNVASRIGISDVHANLLPEDKEKVIAMYRKEGKPVMMVGDGVNDAPALVRADIGVAIGAGTDVAIDSADVVLVKSDPSDILHFFSLANNTTRKMLQNLWWGAGYNIIAIPLAAGVLAPLGIVLSPAVGAILMSVSTIVVAINAMTLKIK